MPPLETDFQQLQGSWRQIDHEADGIAGASDNYHRNDVITLINGDRFTVRSQSAGVLLHGRFEIDPTQAPKWITWFDAIGPDAGQALPAIYELDGDYFRFVATDSGQPRPVEFRTDAGQVMRCFVRA